MTWLADPHATAITTGSAASAWTGMRRHCPRWKTASNATHEP